MTRSGNRYIFAQLYNFYYERKYAKIRRFWQSCFFITSENYGVASAFSRWSEVDSLLLALAASIRSCGRRLRMYCVIEIPHAISRNNARGSTYTFTGREGATNVWFSGSYSASVTLSKDMPNSISNFCI